MLVAMKVTESLNNHDANSMSQNSLEMSQDVKSSEYESSYEEHSENQKDIDSDKNNSDKNSYNGIDNSSHKVNEENKDKKDKQLVKYNNGAENSSEKPKKIGWIRRFMRKRVDSIPLSTKLLACTFVVLTVAAFGISLSIRQLVENYLIEKTDTQLTDQAQLIYDNIDLLRSKDGRQSTVGPNDYFLQVRDIDNKILSTPLVPPLKGDITSIPTLPEDGSLNGVSPNKPFTTPAQVKGNLKNVSSATVKTASAPWRVLVLKWGRNTSEYSSDTKHGYVYIALSLSDQIDTINTLTQYCLMVSITVILFGVFMSTIIIQSTLKPLKRIEKNRI